MLRNLYQTLHGNRQEKPCAVVNFCGGNDFLCLLCFQVGGLEIVGSIEICDQSTLRILNQCGASSSWGFHILHVMDKDTIGTGTLFQLLGIFIGTNTSHVSGLTSLSYHPLGDTDAILCG